VLTEYRFGNKDVPHRFCSICGTSILIDFKESPYEEKRDQVALNVSMSDTSSRRADKLIERIDSHDS
jgi:hypothetical protein